MLDIVFLFTPDLAPQFLTEIIITKLGLAPGQDVDQLLLYTSNL